MNTGSLVIEKPAQGLLNSPHPQSSRVLPGSSDNIAIYYGEDVVVNLEFFIVLK